MVAAARAGAWLSIFAVAFASCIAVPDAYPCAMDGSCAAGDDYTCVSGVCLAACNPDPGDSSVPCSSSGVTCTADVGQGSVGPAQGQFAGVCSPNCNPGACPSGLTCGPSNYCVACTAGAPGC